MTSAGASFTGLQPDRRYRMIVVAENQAGYDVRILNQSTTLIAPELNDLRMYTIDEDSFSLGRVTLATAGNPAPEVIAYLGLDGVIQRTDDQVTNFTHRRYSVDNGWHQRRLDSDTAYHLIVVARSPGGFDVKELRFRTAGIAPELSPLRINAAASNATEIALEQPAFTVAISGDTVVVGAPFESAAAATRATTTRKTAGPGTGCTESARAR